MGRGHRATGLQIATGTVGLTVAVALGLLASTGGLLSLLAIGAAAVFACIAFGVTQLRMRELVLWGVLLIAVFNFTPALFTPTNVADEPLWQKAVKDLPILALLMFAALVPPRATPIPRRLTQVLRAAIGIMALTMALDALFRETALLSFLASCRYYILYPLLALAVIHLAFSRQEILRLCKGIIFLGVIEGCLAVPNFLGLIGESYFVGYVSLGGVEYTRPTATLGNPNNLGLFLGLPAILLLTKAVFDDWRGRVLLVPILVGMALSFSKTVAVAAALALIIVAVFDRRRGGWVRPSVMVALSGAFIFLTVAGRVGGDVSAEALLGSRTANVPDAFAQWTSTASTILFGNGYGSQENVASLRSTDVITTDNMLLQVALEGGLLGVTVFAFVVYLICRLAFSLGGRDASRLTKGFGTYLIFFVLYAPVANNFRLFPGALFFWMVAGFMVSLGVSEPREAGEIEDGRCAASKRPGPRAAMGSPHSPGSSSVATVSAE